MQDCVCQVVRRLAVLLGMLWKMMAWCSKSMGKQGRVWGLGHPLGARFFQGWISGAQRVSC